jgi:hypothetical protein
MQTPYVNFGINEVENLSNNIMKLLVKEGFINLKQDFLKSKSSQVIRLIDLANKNPLFNNDGKFIRKQFHNLVDSLSITELGIYVTNCINLPRVGDRYTQPNDIIFIKNENILIVFVEEKKEQDDALIIYLFYKLFKLCQVTVITNDDYFRLKNNHQSIFSSCINQLLNNVSGFSHKTLEFAFKKAWLRNIPYHEDQNAMIIERWTDLYYDWCDCKQSYDRESQSRFLKIKEIMIQAKMDIDNDNLVTEVDDLVTEVDDLMIIDDYEYLEDMSKKRKFEENDNCKIEPFLKRIVY